MGASGDNVLAEKLAQAKKLTCNLQSDDKFLRKQALKELQTFLSKRQDFEIGDYHIIFNEIQLYSLNLLRDKCEPVREQCIIFTSFLILDCLPINDYYLSYVFPIFVERLGSVEIVEESEELRLRLVELIDTIIDKYSEREQLKPFLNDIIKIYAETVKDKYPAIKELTCKSIVLLSKALPRDFHTQCETLIKPVLTCFNHQRYKIRVEAVRCIGVLIMHSTYKGLEDALIPMAERLFDQMPIVRRTVAQVAAKWLMEYRDRYSFFQKLLPLLLTGLIDEVEETKIEATKLWEQVGLQYEKENEEDLKDKINFLNTPPKYYAENIKRPNLGCRVLVQRNIGRMVSALSNELTSWQVDIRIRCSQLLCAIALHAESGFTHHLQGILPAMYSAARDEDIHVVENIEKASELLGLFVPYETWSKLILPTMEDGPHYGHLLVLAGLIRGCPKEYIDNDLLEPSKLLADPIVLFSRKQPYQREMFNCVKAIISKLPTKALEVETNLFVIVVCLVALKSENEGIKISLLDDLAKALTLENANELWSRNLSELLRIISKDPKAWVAITPERCIFEIILLESGKAFGENLEQIGDILIETLSVNADAESRLKTFIALSHSLKNKDVFFSEKSENVTKFLEVLTEKVFIPSLVWHAGNTAEAMRTMTSSCLLSALTPCENIDLFADESVLKSIFSKLLPLLISLCEDASSKTRALALENLVALKELLIQKNDLWDVDSFVKVYPEVLKRLDDPTNFVRTCSVKALAYIFKDCPDKFKNYTYKAHHEMILDTLLVHFDDDDEDFQDNVMDVFKVLKEVCYNVIAERVERHRNLLRNKTGCDRIMDLLK